MQTVLLPKIQNGESDVFWDPEFEELVKDQYGFIEGLKAIKDELEAQPDAGTENDVQEANEKYRIAMENLEGRIEGFEVGTVEWYYKQIDKGEDDGFLHRFIPHLDELLRQYTRSYATRRCDEIRRAGKSLIS